MANLRDHQYAADGRAGGGFNGNGRNTFTCESNWGTDNLGTGDSHRVFKAAKACVVSNFRFVSEDLDTDDTPTLVFDVGTDTDDDEFIAATDVGQGGGTELTNTASTGTATEAGFPLAAGEYIIVTVSTGAATAAAGKTTLHFDAQFLS